MSEKVFNATNEIGPTPAMGKGGWCFAGSLCALLALVLLIKGGVHTPIPGHEKIQGLAVIWFTAFSAGAVLGFGRCLPAEWTIVTFIITAGVAIVALLGTPPEMLKFMHPWGWSVLLVFSAIVVLERARSLRS